MTSTFAATLRCMWRVVALLASLMFGGCAFNQLAVDGIGDAVARNGGAFASDDDPELIRAAAPFSLKFIESLLAENGTHKGLLLAGARGFTQYAYAFLQQDADEVEERDVAAAMRLQERARRLYSRARDYGARGLGVDRPNFINQLRDDPQRALAAVPASDVALLYWTGVSWSALIGLSKGNPDVLGELPIVEALMDRALALDESFDHGALHTFMISYESVRQGGAGDAAARARRHFARAMALSGGADAAPLLALAEAVCVPQQRRAEFEALLRQALRIDTSRATENRLANVMAQHRARWLLSRTENLFTN
ncbi:MAG: TRAP transporter TatT component family protein [Burkholderiaceae bacterium]|nr:TRAP transporter TatT component family protein [Burkholderiaceae bacterium]